MPSSKSEQILPIFCIDPQNLDVAGLEPAQSAWLTANGFKAGTGKLLALPTADGGLGGYAFGLGAEDNRSPLVTGLASAQLKPGTYRLEGEPGDVLLAPLAFQLGAYRFDQYKSGPGAVELDSSQVTEEVTYLTEAAFLARDLINTPPNVLGPDEFEKRIRDFGGRHGMHVTSIAGDALLEQKFPMIHAVGRASAQAPRLLDLTWGNQDAPKVTLVGKGVTFDTGGLDIKSAAGMLIMKKDMGGAANILGLAHSIMSAKLDVRLRVLIPVVENAISGNAFRPGDILPSRAGINVEIGNTDAEGRLILADALALASEEDPELIIDMATLTGAARVALGPDLPPIYSTDDALADQLVANGLRWGDPLWHMPLWPPYDDDLSSKVADVSHVSSGGMAGSVTAALFLQRFVKTSGDWVHCDIYGWAPKAVPGRSQGGTDQAMRAAFFTLKSRFG